MTDYTKINEHLDEILAELDQAEKPTVSVNFITDYNIKMKILALQAVIQWVKAMAILIINMWKLWAEALGEKATICDKESDKVAWIRTFLITQSVITNIFIVANVLRHWHNS